MKNKKSKFVVVVLSMIVLALLVSITLISCNNNKKKIGAQSGTIAYYTIGSVNGKKIQAVGYKSPALAVTELINGNLEAVLVDDQVGKELVNKFNGKIKMLKNPVDSGEFAFGFKKGNDAFKEKVNNWIEKNQSKIDEYKKDPSKIKPIEIEKYTSGESEEDTFVLYTSPDYPPYENIDGNKYVGIDIQIAADMASDFGLNLKIAEFEFDGLIPALKTTNAKNAICMAGLSKTEDREKEIDFSTTYVKSTQVLLVKKSNNKYDNYTEKQMYELVAGKEEEEKK